MPADTTFLSPIIEGAVFMSYFMGPVAIWAIYENLFRTKKNR